jgi:hypothetical protein
MNFRDLFYYFFNFKFFIITLPNLLWASFWDWFLRSSG